MEIRTCQFNDSYFPVMDGVGMTAHYYALGLYKKYGNATLVAPKVKGYADRSIYDVIRFKSVLFPGMNPYRIGLPWIDFEFKSNFRKQSFDILHAHSPFISGFLAQELANKKKIPLIATFHSKYREDFKKVIKNDHMVDLMLKSTIEFYNKVDHVWVPNRSTGETLTNYGFEGDFNIVANGTDIDLPRKSEFLRMRHKGIDAIHAKENDFVMLFVGQHRWEKNIKLIIEALRKLKDRNESYKMVFVGEGYASAEMKKMIHKYRLTDHVTMTGVITDREKLKTIYACSNLFLFPSLYDNAPLVMLEAAAFGVPSIVVRNSSAAENIIDNVNGFCIENSTEALVNKIIDLKSNPGFIRRAGIEATKTIYKNWESVVEDVSERYLEIIQTHKEKTKKKKNKKLHTQHN